MDDDSFASPGIQIKESAVQKRQGSFLPHWRKDGAVYFVTSRLDDALPTSKVKEWLWERNDILKTAASVHRELSPHEIDRLEDLSWKHIDDHLRKGHGEWRTSCNRGNRSLRIAQTSSCNERDPYGNLSITII